MPPPPSATATVTVCRRPGQRWPHTTRTLTGEAAPWFAPLDPHPRIFVPAPSATQRLTLSGGFGSVAVAVPAPPRLLLNHAVGQATGAVAAQLGGGEGVGRVAGRLAWGSLWAVYVCVVLCALLIMALLGGGLLVGKMVEEPVQVTETLNFDYTKSSPVAFVPVRRLVPPHQRMQLELSLPLPESDYNRRLGVFQGLQLICRPQSSLREKLAGICTSMDLSCSD